MAVNRFVLNNISYHGAGAIGEIPGEIARRGFAKAFVCSDPDLVRFGVTGKVTAKLDEAGILWELYDQIKPNPTIKNVQDGVAAFKASGADMIVAVGGGSAMDTAKGIGIIAENPEFADVVSLEGVAPTKNHATFTIAVPPRRAQRPRLPSTTSSPTRRRCASSCASTSTISPTWRWSTPT